MTRRPARHELASRVSVTDAKNDAIAPMRRVATGVLAFLAVVYAFTFTVDHPGYTVLLIRSMAEAGMVGGLADWFAVEALFRHPLRLPIPHTALLPRNQKRAASNIARFIDERFLMPDQVLARVRKANPAHMAAQWLADPSNARMVAQELAFLLKLFLKQKLERGVRIGASAEIRDLLNALARSEDLPASISAFLKETVGSGLMDDVIAEVRKVLDENRDTVNELVQDRSRWWIASTVDRTIVKVLVDGILSIMDELGDRESTLRKDFDRSVTQLVDAIQQSGRIAAFIGEAADKWGESPAFATAVDAVVEKVLDTIRESLEENPDRATDVMADALSAFAENLRHDAALQERLNERLVSGAAPLLEAGRPAIVAYIAKVIEEWESDDLVAYVEREVGRDLQFIRINGAVLGALVGGALHVATSFAH